MEDTHGAGCLTVALRPGQTLTLDDARHCRIVAATAMVWITQERDACDHILRPASQFTVERPGRTVIEALTGGLVRLHGVTASPVGPARSSRVRGRMGAIRPT
ncbi:MAG: DUF2917 domain-containing protein [Rudaea sp.]